MAHTPSFSLKRSPKNLKRSIHEKYRRRLRNLAHVVEDFLDAARRKLRFGRINHRAKIEIIVNSCEKLAELLPDPQAVLSSAVKKRFEDILGLADSKAVRKATKVNRSRARR